MNSFEEELPYKFIRSEPGIFVEIYLPKKADFQGTLYDTLIKGFNISKVKNHLRAKKKSIQKMLETYETLVADYDSFVDELQPIFFGYSMYEVDGVFVGKKNKIYEERTQVIRLLFRPELDKIFTDNKYKGKEQEIAKITKEYLRTTRSQKEYVIKNQCDDFAIDIIEGIHLWGDCVGLFLFGYIIYEICAKISDLCKNEKLSWDEAEEEIWVTSIWNMVVNPIKFQPDMCQSD